MKASLLFPGQAIATDQMSLVPEGPPRSRQCTGGGTVFVDMYIGKVRTYHEASISASDTIRSKMTFERDCHTYGVGVQANHGDKCMFNSAEFI
jgi:hypothetical protein